MGGGCAYGFEELGHEMETVSRGTQKLALRKLIHAALEPLGVIEGKKTNLL